MSSPQVECPRCGLRRYVRSDRTGALCEDCRYANSVPTAAHGLPAGEWVNRAGVRRFIPYTPPVLFADPCHCGDYYTGRSCPSCLAWAERNARLHAETRISKANRGRIWDILDARKSVLEGVA